MKRRTLLASGLALAAPGIARAQASTLRFVPVADVTVLDPFFAGPDVTIQHANMVYDALYGLDRDSQPHPQMAEGAVVEDDGRLWRIRLREGLRFHDNEPVLARDAVASLNRWLAIDVFAGKLRSVLAELRAADDRTIEFRLTRPFPLLPYALAKPATYPAYVLPERLVAGTERGRMPEVIGSGPFRYRADERVVGSRVVYEKFAGYVPRAEPGNYMSGGKRVFFDRVEWRIIPDASTAIASLQKGEVDWVSDIGPDHAPALRRDPKLVIQIQDFIGGEAILRFNALHPPFDNPAVRRAVLPAIRQADFMTAIAGDDRDVWRDRVGVWSLGKPMSTDAGVEVMEGDLAASQRLLRASGYNGERIVVLAAGDYPSLFAVSQVGADLLRRIGFNVDLQVMDYGTQIQRRASKAPPAQGGWNVVFNWFNGFNRYDPAAHLGITPTWVGWVPVPEIQALRDQWFEVPDLAARQAIAREIQLLVWRDVPYIPLGTYYPLTGYLRGLNGVPKGGVTFFNISKG
jgi:peptide/nickel transport system substrate-binding protein